MRATDEGRKTRDEIAVVSSGALDSAAGSRIEWLCLAAIIVLSSFVLPRWVWGRTHNFIFAWIDGGNYYFLLTLGYGLVLALPSSRRSGLRIGDIRSNAWRTALVCGAPVLLTAIVYPRLPVQPFQNAPIGMWLVSPLAQDLVFTGYLYGRFDAVFPAHLHPRVRVRWAVVITALFFAGWHLQNFGRLPTRFVALQVPVTFLGWILAGLARQWTGSILYGTISHMGVNFIAWCAGLSGS